MLMTWTLRPDATLTRPGSGPSALTMPALSTLDWLDSGNPSNVLCAMTGVPLAATGSVTLLAQPSDVQPPANAVNFSPLGLTQGLGFGSVKPGPYIADVSITFGGQTRIFRYDINILSNQPTTLAAANSAELAQRIADVSALVTAQGTDFAGAVIELQPGVTYTAPAFNFPTTAITRRIVIRSAATDRRQRATLGGSNPIIQGGTLPTACRQIMWQNIEFRPTSVGGICFSSSTNIAVEFAAFVGCMFQGARPVPTPSVQMAFGQQIDPTTDWLPGYTCFYSNYSGSGFNRLDLRPGHAPGFQVVNGAPVGTWQAAPEGLAGFVGANTPTGGPGIFTSAAGQIFPVNNFGFPQTEGSGFEAEFEVAFLTDTPVMTVNGGMQRKPAGADDGNFIVAWRVNAPGNGYTSVAFNRDVLWQHQIQPFNSFSPGLIAASGQTGRLPNVAVSNCFFVNVNDCLRLFRTSTTDNPWVIGNRFDSYVRDCVQIQPSANFTDPDELRMRIVWNEFGRTFVQQGEWSNPHQDNIQLAAANTSPSRTSRAYASIYGNLSDGGFAGGGANRSRGNPQIMLLGDNNNTDAGWQAFVVGNFARSDTTHQLSADKVWRELSYLNQFSGTMSSSNQSSSVRPDGTKVYQRTIAQGVRSSNGARAVNVLAATPNVLGLWQAPTTAWLSNWAAAKAAFTPIPGTAAEGLGPFGDPECIDQLKRCIDLDRVPFRTVFPDVVNVQPNAVVNSAARLVWYGRRDKTVRNCTGGQWRKAAGEAGVATAVLGTANGTLTPKVDAIGLQMTASPLRAKRKTMTIEIDGELHTFGCITEDEGSTGGPTAPGTLRFQSGGAVPSVGSRNRKLVLFISFFLTTGYTGFRSLWSGAAQDFISINASGEFSVRLNGTSAFQFSLSGAVPNAENRLLLVVDATQVSPFIDDRQEPPLTIANGNGTVRAWVNSNFTGPFNATINTLEGTRALDVVGGRTHRALGDASNFAPAGMRLGCLGIRQYAAADALPDFDDPEVISLFSNANIGTTGQFWPGAAPDIFIRPTTAQANAGAYANLGALGGPEWGPNGTGTFS